MAPGKDFWSEWTFSANVRVWNHLSLLQLFFTKVFSYATTRGTAPGGFLKREIILSAKLGERLWY